MTIVSEKSYRNICEQFLHLSILQDLQVSVDKFLHLDFQCQSLGYLYQQDVHYKHVLSSFFLPDWFQNSFKIQYPGLEYLRLSSFKKFFQ